MRKLIPIVLLILASIAGHAQNTSTYGNITTGAATCTPRNCVYYQVPPNTPWVTINIAGTWSGTLQVQSITDTNATYQNINTKGWTLLSTQSTNGNLSIANGQSVFILVVAPSWSSGTATVTLTGSQSGTPLTNPVFSGTGGMTGLRTPNGGSSSTFFATDGSIQAAGSPGQETSGVSAPTVAGTVALAAATQPPGSVLTPSVYAGSQTFIQNAGLPATATCTIDPTNNNAITILPLALGMGYTTAPSVTITGSNLGTAGAITATVVNGQVTAYSVAGPNSGWRGGTVGNSNCNVTINVSPPGVSPSVDNPSPMLNLSTGYSETASVFSCTSSGGVPISCVLYSPGANLSGTMEAVSPVFGTAATTYTPGSVVGGTVSTLTVTGGAGYPALWTVYVGPSTIMCGLRSCSNAMTAYTPVVRVDDFGAVGDGVTDDAPAMNAATAWAAAHSVSTIALTQGKSYYLGSFQGYYYGAFDDGTVPINGNINLTVSGGALTGCSVGSPAGQYLSTTAPYSLSAGGGSGGAITYTLNISTGSLATCTVTVAGSGYNNAGFVGTVGPTDTCGGVACTILAPETPAQIGYGFWLHSGQELQGNGATISSGYTTTAQLAFPYTNAWPYGASIGSPNSPGDGHQYIHDVNFSNVFIAKGNDGGYNGWENISVAGGLLSQGQNEQFSSFSFINQRKQVNTLGMFYLGGTWAYRAPSTGSDVGNILNDRNLMDDGYYNNIIYFGAGGYSASVGVVNITQVTAGSGMTPGTQVPITFSGGGGTGAAGILTVYTPTTYGWVVTAVGSGYTSAPTPSVTGTGGTPPVLAAAVSSSATFAAVRRSFDCWFDQNFFHLEDQGVYNNAQCYNPPNGVVRMTDQDLAAQIVPDDMWRGAAIPYAGYTRYGRATNDVLMTNMILKSPPSYGIVMGPNNNGWVVNTASGELGGICNQNTGVPFGSAACPSEFEPQNTGGPVSFVMATEPGNFNNISAQLDYQAKVAYPWNWGTGQASVLTVPINCTNCDILQPNTKSVSNPVIPYGLNQITLANNLGNFIGVNQFNSDSQPVTWTAQKYASGIAYRSELWSLQARESIYPATSTTTYPSIFEISSFLNSIQQTPGNGTAAVKLPGELIDPYPMAGGNVTSITLGSGGTGFTPYAFVPCSLTASPATLPQSNSLFNSAVCGAQANGSGAISNVWLSNSGAGYTSVPSVTFGGTGTGATATAALSLADGVAGAYQDLHYPVGHHVIAATYFTTTFPPTSIASNQSLTITGVNCPGAWFSTNARLTDTVHVLSLGASTGLGGLIDSGSKVTAANTCTIVLSNPTTASITLAPGTNSNPWEFDLETGPQQYLGPSPTATSYTGSTATYLPTGSSGVTSINSTTGAFTFTGAGVSCATTTCTFSGGGSGIGSITWSVPSYMAASPTTISSTGTQAFTFNSQSANQIFASPNGSSGVPVFRSMVAADGPTATNSALGFAQCDGTTITCASGIMTATSGGAGTVTSFAAPSGSWPTWLVPTVTNSTTTPSLAVAAASVTANSVFGNVASTSGAPSFNTSQALSGQLGAEETSPFTNAGVSVGTFTASGTNAYSFYANAPSGATNNYLLGLYNSAGSTAEATISQGGSLTIASNFILGASGYVQFNGIANLSAPSTGLIRVGSGATAGTAGSLSMTNSTESGTNTAAIFAPTSAQTTVSCSTSGSAIFSEPLQGSSDKKVLIHLSACLGTASYTYPTAFTNTPSIFGSSNVATSIVTTVSTTAVTVTGATSTGSVVLEDY